MYGRVDDLVTYLIVTYNNETSVAAAECVTHQKVLHATATFILKIRGIIVITSTLKSSNPIVASAVPVTVVPCMISQVPM